MLVVANDERTCYQLREVCLSTYNNTMLHCYLAVVIIAIHVQYLCKGGMKLLQRQFERLLASKQLRRPPEGAFFCILCTHLFNIFCNTESILCFIHQLVPCFCLLGASAFQTEEVQVSHYTIFYCLLRGY